MKLMINSNIIYYGIVIVILKFVSNEFLLSFAESFSIFFLFILVAAAAAFRGGWLEVALRSLVESP